MSAVFKREFKSFFTSPVGYFVLAILFFFSGFFFYVYNLSSGDKNLSGVFGNLYTMVLLLIIPVLTMRAFSEEKKQKTDQAFLTAPVSMTGVVMGKFFACLLVFAIGLCITLIYGVVIAFVVTPDWLAIVGNYVGLLLLGGLVIAAGIFFSSLTESQFIAALATFTFSMVLILIDSLSGFFGESKVVTEIVSFLSVSARYGDFTMGIFNYDSVFFFLSFQALFLFLTIRTIDRKRWI